jgi:hypothetical protein
MKRIMFNDKYGLTAAVISGRKTMTRRACNIAIAGIDVPIDNMFVEDGIWKFTFRDKTYSLAKKYYPKYNVGDTVAVLQNYASLSNLSENLTDELIESAGFTNKMFVKAELMPYKIEITNIRAERLQDISDEDCIKEGVIKNQIGYYISGLLSTEDNEAYTIRDGIAYKLFPNPRRAFEALINKVSGKSTWTANKWHWVYEFKLVVK